MKLSGFQLLIVNAQVKGYVRDHNCKFTLREVERLVKEGFSCVTSERWKKLVIKPCLTEDWRPLLGAGWFVWDNGTDCRSIYHPHGRQLWWFIIQLGRFQFRRFWFWRRVMLHLFIFFWLAPIGATNLPEIFRVSIQWSTYISYHFSFNGFFGGKINVLPSL